MPSPFYGQDADGSPGSGVTVTPSDATVFRPPLRGFYVGGAGNVAVRMANSQTTHVLTATPIGRIYSIKVDQILATGTTATLIVGLF